MLPWLSHSHCSSSICLCIAFMPHGPHTSLLISCYFSILLSFLHIFIHSLQFRNLSMHIHFFSFKTLKLTEFICIHVTTTRMTSTPMNKQETTYSLVLVIVCKTGNLAETNFTKRAGKDGVMNWTSSHNSFKKRVFAEKKK